MSDLKDKHIITTNGDAAMSEQKRIAERFDIDMASLCDLVMGSKGDVPMTDEEIEMIKESCECHDMAGEEDTNQLLRLEKDEVSI